MAIDRVLQSELSKLVRREARDQSEPARKSATQARQDIAALKRRIDNLERLVAHLQKTPARGFAVLDAERDLKSFRYTSRGVRAQRDRLGLSAEDFGKLLGVSSQAVYNWEHGTARPRQGLMDKLATLRAISKRDARARLRALNGDGAA
jgi:DNA-binding transcriptional regulator YiaG